LTYKSIETILEERVGDGTLERFVPALDPDEALIREAYLSARTREYLRGTTNDGLSKDYLSRARANIKDYIIGVPIEDDGQTIKHLSHNYGDRSLSFIWEFKILMMPQSRIIGVFLAMDKMVLISPSLRQKLSAAQFRRRMEQTRDDWAGMFPGHKWMQTGVLADVVSNVI
jgi:hypothetical protein